MPLRVTVAGDYALGDPAFCMSTQAVLSDVAAEYRKHLNGNTGIAFCTTVGHYPRARLQFFLPTDRSPPRAGNAAAANLHSAFGE
jgi:hypothetical protein